MGHLPLELVKITTPVAEATVMTAAGKKPVIVPVLRASLGMSQGLLELMSSARIGHRVSRQTAEHWRTHVYRVRPDDRYQTFGRARR